MTVVRQQKWVFCLQIEEVRESERDALDAAFRAALAPYVSLVPGDESIYIDCDRTRYDSWDLKCCSEAWFTPDAIAALPTRIATLVGAAYPGPASNISSWNSPALASPAYGVRPTEQFREVDI